MRKKQRRLRKSEQKQLQHVVEVKEWIREDEAEAAHLAGEGELLQVVDEVMEVEVVEELHLEGEELLRQEEGQHLRRKECLGFETISLNVSSTSDLTNYAHSQPGLQYASKG